MLSENVDELGICLFIFNGLLYKTIKKVGANYMKKALSVLLSVCMFLALAACSPQSQSNGTSEFFATPAPIVVPEPVEQTNKSLKIYYSDYASMPLMDTAVQLYKKQYPDVELEVEKTYSADLEDYNTKYQQMANQIMAGEGPDLFVIDQGAMDVEKMVRQGVFADMEPFFEEDDFDWESYQKAVLDGGVWDEKRLVIPCTYSIPLAITTQTALDETGFSVENCSDFMSFMDESNKILDNTANTRALFTSPLSANSFYMDAGIEFLNYDNKTVYLESDEMKKGLEWYKKIVGKSGTNSVVSSELLQGAEMIWNKQALFDIPILESIYQINASFAALDTADEAVIFPIRNINGGVTAHIDDAVAVRNNSENLQNAYHFIKILLSPECMSSAIGNSAATFSVLNQFNYDYWKDTLEWQPNNFYSYQGEAPFGEEGKPFSEEDFNQIMGYIDEIDDAYFSDRSGMRSSMEPYFNGELSLDEAITQAERELELYLTE